MTDRAARVPDVQLATDAERLWASLPTDGTARGNLVVRESLAWIPARYEAARDALVAAGRAKKRPWARWHTPAIGRAVRDTRR